MVGLLGLVATLVLTGFMSGFELEISASGLGGTRNGLWVSLDFSPGYTVVDSYSCVHYQTTTTTYCTTRAKVYSTQVAAAHS